MGWLAEVLASWNVTGMIRFLTTPRKCDLAVSSWRRHRRGSEGGQEGVQRGSGGGLEGVRRGSGGGQEGVRQCPSSGTSGRRGFRPVRSMM